jgi:hypothetical protein
MVSFPLAPEYPIGATGATDSRKPRRKSRVRFPLRQVSYWSVKFAGYNLIPKNANWFYNIETNSKPLNFWLRLQTVMSYNEK